MTRLRLHLLASWHGECYEFSLVSIILILHLSVLYAGRGFATRAMLAVKPETCLLSPALATNLLSGRSKNFKHCPHVLTE